MKLLKETIELQAGSSFKILLTPGLYDTFLWHFHPEYEIVYVEGSSGIRHVGDHISKYRGSDLVFIGPNIPHLNFDYGVRTKCEQVIIQMKEEFLGNGFLQIPEMKAINELFKKAHLGLSFGDETKTQVGAMLKQISLQSPFDQLLSLLKILKLLAASDAVEVLQVKPIQSHALEKRHQRMAIISRYVHEKYSSRCDVNEVSELVSMSTSAFCRFFKQNAFMTFTDFVNEYRINQAKNDLLTGSTVSETCYAAGFESLSYFNKLFKKMVGVNPSDFKKAYLG